MNIVVVGLESSVTKLVTQYVAKNLEIEGADLFDGHHSISNDKHLVQHYSYPYQERDNYPEVASLFEDIIWDKTVICTRDFYCSLKSKATIHQKNKKLALEEHRKGMEKLKVAYNYSVGVRLFSYESWFLLGKTYFADFIRSLDITCKHLADCKDINEKWVND